MAKHPISNCSNISAVWKKFKHIQIWLLCVNKTFHVLHHTKHSVIIQFNVPRDPPQHLYNLIPPSHHLESIQFDSSTTKHSVIIQFDLYHTIILELFKFISSPYQHSALIQFDSSTTPFCDHSTWFLHHQFDSSH